MEKETKEKGKMVGRFFLKKFESQEAFERGEAYHNGFVGQNLLLNEGINELWTILCSSGGTKFDNGNAYLGVGDSSTAAAAGQTGLQATTNKAYEAMDTSFPTYGTSQKVTFQATFEAADANHGWKEFTVANGNSDSSKNLNRLVSDQGTKTNGQVWQLSLEITLS